MSTVELIAVCAVVLAVGIAIGRALAGRWIQP